MIRLLALTASAGSGGGAGSKDGSSYESADHCGARYYGVGRSYGLDADSGNSRGAT